MDELFAFSNKKKDYLKHLKIVLSRLHDEQLFAATCKCAFIQNDTEFLGHMVRADGIRVNSKKAKVVKTWPTPSSLTEVSSFVGLHSFSDGSSKIYHLSRLCLRR